LTDSTSNARSRWRSSRKVASTGADKSAESAGLSRWFRLGGTMSTGADGEGDIPTGVRNRNIVGGARGSRAGSRSP
jgi:hypothetical protein